jgi:hypothetical protein
MIDNDYPLSFISRKHQSKFFFDQYKIPVAEEQENIVTLHVNFDTKLEYTNDKKRNKLLSYS